MLDADRSPNAVSVHAGTSQVDFEVDCPPPARSTRKSFDHDGKGSGNFVSKRVSKNEKSRISHWSERDENAKWLRDCLWLCHTAISPLYKLIWPLHVRIRGNWAESVSTLLKNGAIVRSFGDTGTKMAPSFCWDFKLSNEGSFVEIGQEMTKLGRKVWKKSLQSLRAELQSLGAESIAVCMQRWSFRRRSLSWETSFDWSEMKVRALPGVSPHPAVRNWPGFQIKWTQPDFSWFLMRTIPAAENRGVKRANVVLHVDLCKEIFARKHTATHKPTSAQPTHSATMTHTHTHTYTY